MPTDRTARVSEVIRRELSVLLPKSLDLEGQIITISEVRAAPDLKQAYVFLSVLEQTMPNGEILRLLNKNKKEWQSEIGRRINTKFTPRLTFQIDDVIQRGDRIMQVLQEIETKAKES